MSKCVACGKEFNLPEYLTDTFCDSCSSLVRQENFEHVKEIACWTCRYFRKWYNPCDDCEEKIFWNMNPDDICTVLRGLKR